MAGRIYQDNVTIGGIQIYRLPTGVSPVGVLDGSSGDIALVASSGVTWQCRGGTNWIPLNGQNAGLYENALIQRGALVPGSAAMSASGILNASTFVEDATARGVDNVGGVFFDQDTQGVTGDDAYISTPIFGLVGECRPYIAINFSLAQITDIRFVAGISNAGVPAVFAADDPAAAQFLLQFSTPRADANFQFAVRGSNPQVLTDTGVAPVAGRRYTFIIDYMNLQGASYYGQLILIDRTTNQFSAVQTVTDVNDAISTIPTSVFCGLETQANVVKTINQYGIDLTLRGATAVPA